MLWPINVIINEKGRRSMSAISVRHLGKWDGDDSSVRGRRGGVVVRR